MLLIDTTCRSTGEIKTRVVRWSIARRESAWAPIPSSVEQLRGSIIPFLVAVCGNRAEISSRADNSACYNYSRKFRCVIGAGRRPPDDQRFAGTANEALGGSSQGRTCRCCAGPITFARRSMQPVQVDDRGIPFLAAVDRSAWSCGPVHDAYPAISAETA
jgi:hypothetical protein